MGTFPISRRATAPEPALGEIENVPITLHGGKSGMSPETTDGQRDYRLLQFFDHG
jgi:hypothetical protein